MAIVASRSVHEAAVNEIRIRSACISDTYVRDCAVNSGQFVRRLRRYARRHGLRFSYDPRRGKGSHGRVLMGNRLTTVKSSNKPLGAGLLRKMLKDLGIDPEEF